MIGNSTFETGLAALEKCYLQNRTTNSSPPSFNSLRRRKLNMLKNAPTYGARSNDAPRSGKFHFAEISRGACSYFRLRGSPLEPVMDFLQK